MADPYLEKLADVLANYSLGEVDFARAWKNGHKRLLITYEAPADELAKLVTERVLDKGGNVYLDVIPSWFQYAYFTRASEAVLDSRPEEALKRLEHVAARLFIRSESNTRSLATVDPTRVARRNRATKPYRDKAYEVDEKGNFVIPWSVTLFPTEAYAQDMGMPYDEYKAYVWQIMLLDAENPMNAWQAVAERQEKLKKTVLDGTRTLRIVDEEDDTNLSVSVEGHRWIKSEGKRNFPSDEIFNAPRKDSVDGVITFPRLHQHYRSGPEVSGIRLTFKDGKLVDWEANIGEAYLEKFVTQNPGAMHLGEIALGLHPKIQKISKQILFDEKIGGTVHIALGSAYRLHVLGDGDKSQLNDASVHWDMIRDMRKPSAYVEVEGKGRLMWNGATGRWNVAELRR
jgi:aminopeptidase